MEAIYTTSIQNSETNRLFMIYPYAYKLSPLQSYVVGFLSLLKSEENEEYYKMKKENIAQFPHMSNLLTIAHATLTSISEGSNILESIKKENWEQIIRDEESCEKASKELHSCIHYYTVKNKSGQTAELVLKCYADQVYMVGIIPILSISKTQYLLSKKIIFDSKQEHQNIGYDITVGPNGDIDVTKFLKEEVPQIVNESTSNDSTQATFKELSDHSKLPNDLIKDIDPYDEIIRKANKNLGAETKVVNDCAFCKNKSSDCYGLRQIYVCSDCIQKLINHQEQFSSSIYNSFSSIISLYNLTMEREEAPIFKNEQLKKQKTNKSA